MKALALLSPERVLAILRAADRRGKHGAAQTLDDYGIDPEPHVLVDAPLAQLNHEYYDAATGEFMGLSRRQEERVERYARMRGTPPPIRLRYRPAWNTGLAVIVDGNHRAEVAKRAGRETIRAMMPISEFERWSASIRGEGNVATRAQAKNPLVLHVGHGRSGRSRGTTMAMHRNRTLTSHKVGDALVTIERWRLASGTACIHVTAAGPGGFKTWEAKSQGPSSGGFNKAVQAASRVQFKIEGIWGSEGREDLDAIAAAAARAVNGKSNPRRWRVRRGRRNPSYTEDLAEAERELRAADARAAYGSRHRRSNPRGGSADEGAAHELVLFITNDGDLYRQQTQPILANLAKKIRKGVYDKTKAVKLWGYLADSGAQKYTKQFDAGTSTSFGAFSKATRMAAAAELADYYADDLAEKAGTKSNPRRRRRRVIHRRIKMARRKKYRRTKSRRSHGYKGGVRVVRFKVRGRVKIVRFHKPGTKGFRSGVAKKRAAGKRLARKYGFFRKGAAIYQRRPGKKAKLIRRI